MEALSLTSYIQFKFKANVQKVGLKLSGNFIKFFKGFIYFKLCELC